MDSKLLDALLMTSDDAIVVTSPAGIVVEWNPAAEQLLGYQAHEIIGASTKTILPESWWPYYDARLAALKDGTVVHCDSVRRHKSGTLIDVNATSCGLFDDEGRFLGHFNVFKDLKSKREQDWANAFLASIVRASPDAIASTDIDFRILTWNNSAEAMFGCRFDEVRGRQLCEIIPSLAPHTASFRVDYPSQKRIERLETTFERQDGASLFICMTVGSLLNAAGVPTGWAITCSDITDKKKEEEFRRFVMREMSHRAKNLLAVIMAMFRSSAESKNSLDEFEEDFAARIRGLARSHDLLVQDNWHGASLHRLVDTQLQPFVGISGRLQKSGPDVYLAPTAVQCMGLALHELGTNAAKYGAMSRPRGRILVETVPCNDHIDISWTETGGPTVTEPTRVGFGRTVLEDLIADTTGGRARLEFNSDGLKWTARIPSSLIAGAGLSNTDRAADEANAASRAFKSAIYGEFKS